MNKVDIRLYNPIFIGNNKCYAHRIETKKASVIHVISIPLYKKMLKRVTKNINVVQRLKKLTT